MTAYARSRTAVKPSETHVRAVQGELTDMDLLETAITGADAVISTMGPPLSMSRRVAGTPIADGTQRIVHIMERLDAKRLIVIGTPTLRSTQDRPSVSTVVPGLLARILYPTGYREMRKLETVITHSSLDWTVVRFINPNRKDRNSGYGISCGDKPAKLSVSRENVGRFIYVTAKDGLYVHRMPIVFDIERQRRCPGYAHGR